MELSDDFKVVLEAGAGAKMDQQYQTYGTTALTAGTGDPDTYNQSWQPYPGDKKQIGTTMLVHAHLGVVYQGILTMTAHYIDNFARDARMDVGSQGGVAADKVGSTLTPNASIQVFGVDLRLNGGWMGDGYLGASRIIANNANSIADSIEVLHSQGGWQLAHNFFYGGNGSIDTIAGQYTFSLASFLMRPRPFWGQGKDITLTLYGMFNRVFDTDNKGAPASGATIPPNMDNGKSDMKKFKAGIDPIWSFSPMMAVGLRGDFVRPNWADKSQDFFVITPKLIFRSEFVTHEMVVLQASFYGYSSAYHDSTQIGGTTKADSVMPWPYGTNGTLDIQKLTLNGTPQPDKYVISLAASMWW
jgi:hypothetical protein